MHRRSVSTSSRRRKGRSRASATSTTGCHRGSSPPRARTRSRGDRRWGQGSARGTVGDGSRSRTRPMGLPAVTHQRWCSSMDGRAIGPTGQPGRVLAELYHVIAVDLGGHGESGVGREDWNLRAFGDDVVTVIEDSAPRTSPSSGTRWRRRHRFGPVLGRSGPRVVWVDAFARSATSRSHRPRTSPRSLRRSRGLRCRGGSVRPKPVPGERRRVARRSHRWRHGRRPARRPSARWATPSTARRRSSPASPSSRRRSSPSIRTRADRRRVPSPARRRSSRPHGRRALPDARGPRAVQSDPRRDARLVLPLTGPALPGRPTTPVTRGVTSDARLHGSTEGRGIHGHAIVRPGGRRLPIGAGRRPT